MRLFRQHRRPSVPQQAAYGIPITVGELLVLEEVLHEGWNLQNHRGRTTRPKDSPVHAMLRALRHRVGATGVAYGSGPAYSGPLTDDEGADLQIPLTEDELRTIEQAVIAVQAEDARYRNSQQSAPAVHLLERLQIRQGAARALQYLDGIPVFKTSPLRITAGER
jgi:hypothetical protein